MQPNPSIEGTSTIRLRLFAAAPHVKRSATGAAPSRVSGRRGHYHHASSALHVTPSHIDRASVYHLPPRSASREAERSLECDLDTLCAFAYAAHLTGHRVRVRSRRAQSSCRRRDPARRCLRRSAAARTRSGQGNHAAWRRNGSRNAPSAHAAWIAFGVSREERCPALHLDSLSPRSERRILGYPRGPGVARSAGRFVKRRLGGVNYFLLPRTEGAPSPSGVKALGTVTARSPNPAVERTETANSAVPLAHLRTLG